MTVVLPKCERGEFPKADEFKDAGTRDLYYWAGNCHVAIAVRAATALGRISRRADQILYESKQRVP